MAQEAGFTPQAVSPKILFPLLEGASFEENEDLHTMWAALLANASSPKNAAKVAPGFIATLKQMSPEEAKLLKSIFAFCGGHSRKQYISDKRLCQILYDEPEVDISDILHLQKFGHETVDSLEAAQLVRRIYFTGDVNGFTGLSEPDSVQHRYAVTERGRAFIEACSPPKPK
jgi:hypothetical protein